MWHGNVTLKKESVKITIRLLIIFCYRVPGVWAFDGWEMNFSLLTQITEVTFKTMVFSSFCSHFAVVFFSSSGSHSWSDILGFFFFCWQQSSGYSEHNLNHGLAKDFQADYVSCSYLTQSVCWQHFENSVQSPELLGFFRNGAQGFRLFGKWWYLEVFCGTE